MGKQINEMMQKKSLSIILCIYVSYKKKTASNRREKRQTCVKNRNIGHVLRNEDKVFASFIIIIK